MELMLAYGVLTIVGLIILSFLAYALYINCGKDLEETLKMIAFLSVSIFVLISGCLAVVWAITTINGG